MKLLKTKLIGQSLTALVLCLSQTTVFGKELTLPSPNHCLFFAQMFIFAENDKASGKTKNEVFLEIDKASAELDTKNLVKTIVDDVFTKGGDSAQKAEAWFQRCLENEGKVITKEYNSL